MFGHRRRTDHLGCRLAEGLESGGPAGAGEFVVDGEVAHHDGVPTPSGPEEGVGPGDEVGGHGGVVDAEGTVAQHRQPGTGGVEDDAVALLERTPLAPAGELAPDLDQIQMTEERDVVGIEWRHGQTASPLVASSSSPLETGGRPVPEPWPPALQNSRMISAFVRPAVISASVPEKSS